MKTIILAAILAVSPCVKADDFTGQKIAKDTQSAAYNGNLANETALAYSKTFVLDSGPFAKASAQVIYGSATVAGVTFTDGSEGYGKFTFLSTTALSGVKLQIGNKVFVAGTDYTITGNISVSQVALNFISSVNAAGYFPGIKFSSSTPAGVVYATATLNGISHNYMILSDTPGKISVVPMSGGTDSSVSSGSTNVFIPSHGFTKALPVLYFSNSATIGGLTEQTTYYVIPVDANNINLATTSARAVLGLPLKVTSFTNNYTAHSPSLVPLAISGTPSFKWQASNDAVTWVDLNTSSVTMSAYTAGGTTSGWDLSWFNFRWLGLKVVAPDSGGITLKAVLTVKQ